MGLTTITDDELEGLLEAVQDGLDGLGDPSTAEHGLLSLLGEGCQALGRRLRGRMLLDAGLAGGTC